MVNHGHQGRHGHKDRQNRQDSQDRQNWHLNLTFQVTCEGQLSQFLRCFHFRFTWHHSQFLTIGLEIIQTENTNGSYQVQVFPLFTNRICLKQLFIGVWKRARSAFTADSYKLWKERVSCSLQTSSTKVGSSKWAIQMPWTWLFQILLQTFGQFVQHHSCWHYYCGIRTKEIWQIARHFILPLFYTFSEKKIK